MSDPRCEEYRDQVSAFVDERLEGADLLRLERHLDACAGCRQFEADLRQFRPLLQAAEAMLPLRRPPAGFAAGVTARLAREAAASVVPVPGARPARRPFGAWIGLAAAAAAAALFFAWSWQRLLPGEAPAGRTAALPVAAVAVAAADQGNMDSWLRQHALLARDATILGSAEEVEFASFYAASAAGR